MATFTYQKVVALIDEGQTALSNARDTAEILAALTTLNYGLPKITEGLALLTTLETKHGDREQLSGLQTEATRAVKDSLTPTKKTYAKHTKIARALLIENVEVLNRLGLQGNRAQAFGLLRDQMRQFYREIEKDPALLTLLSAGGITQAAIDAAQVQIEAATTSDNAQESAKGLAQQATQDRDAAATAFRGWMDKFWKVADVALADKPQWSEQLGKVVK